MIRYLFDESTHGALPDTVARYCAASGSALPDLVRVGDGTAPPTGTTDPDLLIWAEREGRIIVTDDIRTMPGHLNDHLAAGRRSPGVFLRRPGTPLVETADWLVTIAGAGRPDEYADIVTWIPQ